MLDISLSLLLTTLLTLPPVELQGLALMNAEPPASSQPLKEAVQEFMRYTDSCARTARRLESLLPIALPYPLVDWVL